MRSILAAAALVALAAAIVSCSGSDQGPNAATSLTALSGDGQADTIDATLPVPLIVKVTDAAGNAVSGIKVRWLTGSGYLAGNASKTNSRGQDSALWTLGGTAGAAGVQVTVGTLPPVSFHGTVDPGRPASLFYSGDGQSAPPGAAIAAPLIVFVRDRSGNPVSGVAVTWTVTGGGSLSAYSQATDTQGRVQVTWTLGPTTGAQHATATAGSLTHTFEGTAQ